MTKSANVSAGEIKFLNSSELENLTGYSKTFKQVDWLKNNHYLFEVDCKGAPIVARAYLLNRLVGISSIRREPELRLIK